VAVAALAFGAAGALFGAGVAGLLALPLSSTPASGPALVAAFAAVVVAAAGLGATVTGGALWWLAVERPGEVTRRRGGLAGAAVGVLVHPLLWTLAALAAVVVGLAGDGSVPAATSENVGHLAGLAGALLKLSGLSLLLSGIVTVPGGRGVGLLLVRARRVGRAGKRRDPDEWAAEQR
jgi:hypothetical protein